MFVFEWKTTHSIIETWVFVSELVSTIILHFDRFLTVIVFAFYNYFVVFTNIFEKEKPLELVFSKGFCAPQIGLEPITLRLTAETLK